MGGGGGCRRWKGGSKQGKGRREVIDFSGIKSMGMDFECQIGEIEMKRKVKVFKLINQAKK